ncbi:hypothetical protein D1631_08680 [Chryseobacterium nematophagum]|uniref:Uncharacterized protein n=1 Tax=Chryseobacterium nematophagum TaxID=2305228 RepID=A0A3M7TER0_9FLAO|nr:hypothetical protein [Chryseobacterium nematophagum]RNA62005.1 hypothetical protein D1631_08680 [Chryseobacterium nematophagum]
MKSLEELQDLLLDEIQNNLNKKVVSESHDYYNEYTGYISVLLASILEKRLLKDTDWNSNRWIDDSLLTKLKLSNSKLSIWGIMIWGVKNLNKQWTDPFYFEIEFKIENEKFDNYTFLFGDLINHEISYEAFANNRNYWDVDYYTTSDWSPVERNWKYIIT